MADTSTDDPELPVGVDPGSAHPARRYNYWLGGKDNLAVDRASADIVASAFPTVQLAAVENRRFLERVVTWLVAEAGITQFLDIGAGLPTAGNVHEVAQRIAPESRIVYVDNDPVVLAHSRALLTSTPDGATAYLQADLRDPRAILEHPDVTATLDLSKPVAVMLIAVLHFLSAADHPYELVGTLRDALAPGSCLAISHATSDHLSPEQVAATADANRRSGVTFELRSTREFAEFFTGTELIDPGIGSIVDWHPLLDRGLRPAPDKVSMLGAVARIP